MNRIISILMLGVVGTCMIVGCTGKPSKSDIQNGMKSSIIVKCQNIPDKQYNLEMPLFDVLSVNKTNGKENTKTSYSVKFDGLIKSKQKLYIYLQNTTIGIIPTVQLKPFRITDTGLGRLAELNEGEYKYEGSADFELTEKGWQMSSCYIDVNLMPGIADRYACSK